MEAGNALGIRLVCPRPHLRPEDGHHLLVRELKAAIGTVTSDRCPTGVWLAHAVWCGASHSHGPSRSFLRAPLRAPMYREPLDRTLQGAPRRAQSCRTFAMLGGLLHPGSIG